MKKLLCILALLVAFNANAKPIALSFSRIDLITFLDATYGEILKKNYVLSPELLNQGRKVSLRVQVEDTQLVPFLVGFLDRMGIAQTETGGVIYLTPKSIETPAPLTMPLPDAVKPLTGGSGDVGAPVQHGSPDPFSVTPPAKRDATLYTPSARSAEFLCTVVKATFGASSCNVAAQTVVLTLASDDVERVTAFIASVDKPLPRVLVSATFVEVSSEVKDAFGLSVTASVLGNTLGVTVGSPSSSGAISIKGVDFSAVLDAMKTDGRFKQVASPSGFVDAGEHFTITIGDDTPTLGNVQQDNKGNALQSVVYRPSGVILDVVPRVVRLDGLQRVEAVVKAQVSSFAATATGVNGSPTLSKREVNTSLSLDDGEIVILGGLTGSTTTNSRSSLFGVIPWGYSDGSKKTELLLILTAKVSK
jgi:general secretion pathway protein D